MYRSTDRCVEALEGEVVDAGGGSCARTCGAVGMMRGCSLVAPPQPTMLRLGG
jgi:hypothetical protein